MHQSRSVSTLADQNLSLKIYKINYLVSL